MARIRSVHPSLWTDEEFVSMPPNARLFLIGLWGEADDYGVFEWKPVGLKMRLSPADPIDPCEILGIIADAGFIVKIERSKRFYGVVKNFRVYQRPKNPSSPIVPVDNEISGIIGLSCPSPTPALPQPYPSPSEIPSQMEDGGDKMEDGEKISSLRSDSAGTPAQEASLALQGKEKPAAAKREITSAEYAERRLRALGCDQQQIDEWKIVRKSKRAPLTDTAVIALAREAERANISIPDAVTLCIERNWQSFRAEFLINTPNQQTNGHRNGY